MKTIKEFWKELCQRWKNHMPTFFRRVMWICALISGSAGAAHTAMTSLGIQPHDWWLDIVPYLIAFPAGVAFACKFTQEYTGKPVNSASRHRDTHGRSKVLDRDIDHLHAESPDTGDEVPDNNKTEIEPYNGD